MSSYSIQGLVNSSMAISRTKFGMDSTESLKKQIEEQYNIGKITKIELINGRTVNASYCVWTSVNSRVEKYVLRQYQPKKNQIDIEFEHAIIDHLTINNAQL